MSTLQEALKAVGLVTPAQAMDAEDLHELARALATLDYNERLQAETKAYFGERRAANRGRAFPRSLKPRGTLASLSANLVNAAGSDAGKAYATTSERTPFGKRYNRQTKESLPREKCSKTCKRHIHDPKAR